MKLPRFIKKAFLALNLALTACSTSHFPWVYRIDIQQGNDIDPEDLAEVTIGMTKRQVSYLLGTPVINDTFNQNRWDYFYSYQTGKGKYQRKLLTLYFDGDKLAKIEEKPEENYKLKETSQSQTQDFIQ